MGARLFAGALLAVQLGALWWFLKSDLASYRPFRALADDSRRYWRWCIKDAVAFALPPLIGLALLGRFDALTHAPAEFAGVRTLLPQVGPAELRELAGSAALGLALGTMLTMLTARLRRSRRPFGPLGDVSAVLPRHRGELAPAALLALSAGVTEELAFRLYLPLLVAIVTGSALVGFAAAALIFGVVHRYQGWVGVLATTALGLLLTAVYLMTGLLWLAMALHLVIDLNGLVVRPLLTGVGRRAL